MRVAKDDTVIVISGDDRGKSGKVLKVFPKKRRIIVEGINFIKRHTKPKSRMQPGGMVEKEASIHVSNVMVICPRCSEGIRPRRSRMPEGRSVRTCSKCGEIIGKA